MSVYVLITNCIGMFSDVSFDFCHKGYMKEGRMSDVDGPKMFCEIGTPYHWSVRSWQSTFTPFLKHVTSPDMIQTRQLMTCDNQLEI